MPVGDIDQQRVGASFHTGSRPVYVWRADPNGKAHSQAPFAIFGCLGVLLQI